MRKRTIIIALALLAVVFVGLRVFVPALHWDGGCTREIVIVAVAGDSGQPIRGATVTHLSLPYLQRDKYAGESDADREKWLSSRFRPSVQSDAEGRAVLECFFGAGGLKRFLWWDTGSFSVSGDLEVKAEGFATLRKPLAELTGKMSFSVRRRRPIKVVAKLQRNAVQ